MAAPQLRKSTPVLIVDAIEPSLPFWQERLGFARPTEVPDGDRLGFVILTAGNVEVMYQTAASLRKDSAAHGATFDGDKTFLFVEVDDIDALAAALGGFEVRMTPGQASRSASDDQSASSRCSFLLRPARTSSYERRT